MKKFLYSAALLCLLTPALCFAESGFRPSMASQDGLSMEDALRNVYETNPTLRASREELKAAQELYPQALAGWRPTLGADASIYATDIESGNFSNGDGATTKDLSLSLDQPLFRGGRTTAETDRAKALIMSARSRAFQTEQLIFLQSITAYMDVVRDRIIVDLRQGNQSRLRDEYNAAQERFDAGDLTRTDVVQAESRYARSQAELIDAVSRLETSHAEFESLAGMTARQTFFYPSPDIFLPVDLNAAQEMAEDKNPELIAAHYEHIAAEHGVDATLHELFPQIFAFATYNKQYDPQPGIIDESETQTIGLRASIALYEGGATRSRVRQAKHTANQRYIEINEVERMVKARVTSNWKMLSAARAEMSARQAEIEAATLAREGVSEEARLGTRTILDILDADQELLEARTNLAIARRNEIVALYSLSMDLGLLDYRQFGIQAESFNADDHLQNIAGKILSVSIE